jgi:glucosamine--fructose-6-phosphate aminotransferase (isomerizing)
VGAHNGNIINTRSLRDELSSNGHILLGENDGEVILHLLEEPFYRSRNLAYAAKEIAARMKGAYAYVTTSLDGDGFVSVKNGSSLFLGVGDGFRCVSSDLIAIIDLTRNVIQLQDEDLVHFTSDSHRIYNIRNIDDPIEREVQTLSITPEEITKGDYPHFMLKEIHEIPSKAQELIRYLPKAEHTSTVIEKLTSARRVFFVGAGSSHFAGLLGSFYFGRLAKIPVTPSFGSEFLEKYKDCVDERDVVLLISQSGETKDIKNVLDAIQNRTQIISLVNNIGSTLAMRSRYVLPIASDLEIAVPATKTYVNQVIALLYLALKIAQTKGTNGLSAREFLSLPDMLQTVLDDEEKIAPFVDSLINWPDAYYLGYGMSYPVVLEGALKMKEITYLHVEGMYSGEFKHGSISRLEEGYPVLFVVSEPEKYYVLSHVNEVRTRKGKVLTIGPPDEELEAESDLYFKLPNAHPVLMPILSTVPLYMIAYRTAVGRGFNPDRPRNISKTITVD